ncbi:MAG: hypothetical protein KBD85_03775 [Elusimicrobia bacterium]|nr:hypothetical protein [Elusimicrobiota bacterium]
MLPISVIMEDLDHDVAVLGRLQKAVWGLIRPLARWVLERIVQRYRFLALIIEDLPFMENRVEPGLGGADIMIHSSVRSEEWSRIRQARTLVRKALGRWATILLSNAKNTKLLAHACGTCRMGNDPQTSVVDRFNRAHGVENLYVVDSSFFPSSGGVNPALTIAANALRVAQHIIDTQADAPGTQTSMAFPSTAEPTPPAGEKTLVDLFQENTVTHSQNTFRQYKTTDGSWVSGSPALAPEMEPPVPVRPLSPSQTWGPGETQRRKEGRPRVLFVAEAVALSHPARLLEIARGLDPETYEIHFASDPRYRNVLGPVNFFTHDIESIPSAEFDRTVARGGVFFTEQVIERYVQQERFLFNKIRPDIVVGEFRPSLGISARVAGVPYVSVLNAYYNPTAQVRHVLPEYPLTEWIPQRIGQGLYNLLRSWGYARHGRPVNAVRRRHGLPPLEGDLRHALADADWTLFPDLKRLFPNSALAKNHRFMAPVFWSPNVPLPKWWDRLPADRPVVYANLGSSGRNGVLQRVLNALSALPITVIAATAGRQPGLTVPANAFITDFLPGQDAARRSDLVITNGGNMSGYQALAEGKPIVGLASNVDQFLNMAALEDARVGKLLRAGSFSSQDLQTAVQGLMSDRTVRETAESVSVEIAVASNRVFQNILDKVLSPIPQKKENPTHEKELSRLHSF